MSNRRKMDPGRSGYLIGLGLGLLFLSAEIADEHQMVRAGCLALCAVILMICGAAKWELVP